MEKVEELRRKIDELSDSITALSEERYQLRQELSREILKDMKGKSDGN